MYKRLIFLAILALPGAFLVLAALSLHPRSRARLLEAAGFVEPRTRRAVVSSAIARAEFRRR